MAAELTEGHAIDTDITLTPVGGGRFEVYVNGEKIYDRKADAGLDFRPSLLEIRKGRDILDKA